MAANYPRTVTMVLRFNDKADFDKFFQAFTDEVPIYGALILTLAKGDALEERDKRNNEKRCDYGCEECADQETIEYFDECKD